MKKTWCRRAAPYSAFLVAVSAIARRWRWIALLAAASATGCAIVVSGPPPRAAEIPAAPAAVQVAAGESRGAIEAIENGLILVRLDDGTYRKVENATTTDMRVGYRVRIEHSRALRDDERRFYTDERGNLYDDRGYHYDSRGFRYDARGKRE